MYAMNPWTTLVLFKKFMNILYIVLKYKSWLQYCTSPSIFDSANICLHNVLYCLCICSIVILFFIHKSFISENLSSCDPLAQIFNPLPMLTFTIYKNIRSPSTIICITFQSISFAFNIFSFIFFCLIPWLLSSFFTYFYSIFQQFALLSSLFFNIFSFVSIWTFLSYSFHESNKCIICHTLNEKNQKPNRCYFPF